MVRRRSVSARSEYDETLQKRKNPPGTFRFTLTWVIDPKFFEGMLKEHLLESSKRTEVVRECRRKDAPEQWIRFNPARGDTMHISSTQTRNLIATCPSEKLCDKIQLLSLHPETLVRFVQETNVSRSRF